MKFVTKRKFEPLNSRASCRRRYFNGRALTSYSCGRLFDLCSCHLDLDVDKHRMCGLFRGSVFSFHFVFIPRLHPSSSSRRELNLPKGFKNSFEQKYSLSCFIGFLMSLVLCLSTLKVDTRNLST